MHSPSRRLSVVATVLAASLVGTARAAQTSVAVCDFRAIKSDAATDWIGDGIRQSVEADLSKAHSITLKNVAKEITDPDQAAAAARKDSIDVVVVGSFQVAGDEVRATGKVLQSSGRQVAFLSAKASLKEVFRLQDELTKQVHDALVHEQAPDPNAATTAPADGVRSIPFPGSLLERALADEAAGRLPNTRNQPGANAPNTPPYNPWGGGNSGLPLWGGGAGWGGGWIPYYPPRPVGNGAGGNTGGTSGSQGGGGNAGSNSGGGAGPGNGNGSGASGGDSTGPGGGAATPPASGGGGGGGGAANPPRPTPSPNPNPPPKSPN